MFDGYNESIITDYILDISSLPLLLFVPLVAYRFSLLRKSDLPTYSRVLAVAISRNYGYTLIFFSLHGRA